jgi:type II secretory ATPase GspE/PulE/Tfp pilus assembly ATPase PilB-like protein
VKPKSASETNDGDQQVKSLIEFLFAEAFDWHASDIRLEPRRESLPVRMRFDVVLYGIQAPRRHPPRHSLPQQGPHPGWA